MPLTSVLTDMEYQGIFVDKAILKDMQASVEIKLEMISKDIYDLAGEKFNISSPLQLGNILFGKLGLPGGKKNSRGFKTDIKVLHKLYNAHPIIGKILEYRNLDKLNSTYLSGLDKYIAEDKKIHTIFKQNLTRTGRLSSVEPNIQNIPAREEEGRKIRKAFLPGSDSIFLCADYSQIELRILAHISGDEEMMEAFNNNQDIHTKVASDIFGVPEEAVSKSMRKSAKAVIFGIVYGISGFGLGENLEISAKDAKKFIEKYYLFYPKVKKYMDDIVIKAKEDGYVKTLFNRKRVVEELNSDIFAIRSAGERIALNTPIQGTSADIIKKAMVEIFKEFKNQNLKTKMLLQVHDELIFDTPINEIDKVKEIVKDKMENVIKLSVPIKVEIDEGENWYEAN
jgi:DNA polymerase-1